MRPSVQCPINKCLAEWPTLLDGQCQASEKASLKHEAHGHRGAKKHRVRACHFGRQLIQKRVKNLSKKSHSKTLTGELVNT